MSRDASNRAKAASDTAVNTANTYGGESQGLFNKLSGLYGGMYSSPQGMSQQELADANTAGMQSAGGSVAGAVGQGNLQAARTGNAGGYQYALADAAKKGIAQNSQNALNVQNANTAIKLAQQQQGLQGLQGLQTGAQNAQLGAMGNNVSAINAENAASPGWFQNLTGMIGALGSAAQGAGSVMSGMKGLGNGNS